MANMSPAQSDAFIHAMIHWSSPSIIRLPHPIAAVLNITTTSIHDRCHTRARPWMVGGNMLSSSETTKDGLDDTGAARG